RHPARVPAGPVRGDDQRRPGGAGLPRPRRGVRPPGRLGRPREPRRGAGSGLRRGRPGRRPPDRAPGDVGVTDWERLVRPSVIGLEPYRPGKSIEELKADYGLEEIVKLNWNEGLEGPFPGVRDEVLAELERAWIYPAEAYTELRENVAAWVGATPEQIVPAHGIQALIAVVVHA